jgi:hypothetical protein
MSKNTDWNKQNEVKAKVDLMLKSRKTRNEDFMKEVENTSIDDDGKLNNINFMSNVVEDDGHYKSSGGWLKQNPVITGFFGVVLLSLIGFIIYFISTS